MDKIIDGVLIHVLKRISDERGSVMHVMKSTDPCFKRFGEVYCSSVNPGFIKAWHISENTVNNYVVIKGTIKLVLYDQRKYSNTKGIFQEIFMGEDNYIRVTIPPGIWYGFKCLNSSSAIVCNVTDHIHEDNITRKCDPFDKKIGYDWRIK